MRLQWGLSLSWLWTASLLCAGSLGDPFSICERQVAEAPATLAPYRCFWTVARRTGSLEAAAARLEDLSRAGAEQAPALLYLGQIYIDLGDNHAGTVLERAADQFAGKQEARGEVYALLTLAFYLESQGKLGEARPVLERAVSVARASSDPVLLARSDYGLALLHYRMSDYTGAWIGVRRVEKTIFPEGPADLQQETLNLLGTVEWALGRRQAAVEHFSRGADLAATIGDNWRVSSELYNVALLRAEIEGTRFGGSKRLISAFGKALEAARQAGNHSVEASCLMMLGQLQPGFPGLELFREAETVAKRWGEFGTRLEASRNIKYREALLRPSRLAAAQEDLGATSREAHRHGDLALEARALMTLADLEWALAKPKRALATTASAVAKIERIRALQGPDLFRARAFSRYYSFYRRAASWLLFRADSSAMRQSLDPAVSLLEQARARSLEEALHQGGGTTPPDDAAQHVLHNISQVQKQLQRSDLSRAQRAQLLRDLEHLETEEVSIRTGGMPLGSGNLPLARIDLEEIQSMLGRDELLLSFLIADPLDPAAGPSNQPGSWLIEITPVEISAHPLATGREILDAADAYLGMVQRGDGLEQPYGEALFQLLFSDVLTRPGSAVNRLLLVTEPQLAAVPFAALKDEGSDLPLGERFEIERYPSIVSFRESRDRDLQKLRPVVLALVDPKLEPITEEDAETFRLSLTGQVLPPLPYSVKEGHSLVRLFGKPSSLRSGAEASEDYLKHLDSNAFSVLHLSAHAVVDEVNPEQTALYLSPGAPDQDGLLQRRDIVGLNLRGRLVVIGACSSAAGEMIPGEGTAGLARAFLAARAGAVVSSLWPLRDDVAGVFFTRFYRHLASGQSVAGSLRLVRAELRRAGWPSRWWSGIVVIGDGGFSLSPVPWQWSQTLHDPFFWLASLLVLGLVWLLDFAIARSRIGPAEEMRPQI